MALMIPVITLGGSHADTLVTDHMDAAQYLEAALKAMAECAPNGRDYLTGDAWQAAVKQFELRVSAVRKARDEMAEIAERICDQRDGR